jgi:phospholipid/cholesterol/gamma-HCH transport system substrate-binding protein
VQSIGLDPEDGQNILIRISVDSTVPVTRATTAKLGYQGVTGIAHILLEDKGEDPTPLRGDDGEPPRIGMQSSLIEELSEVGGGDLASGTGFSGQREPGSRRREPPEAGQDPDQP